MTEVEAALAAAEIDGTADAAKNLERARWALLAVAVHGAATGARDQESAATVLGDLISDTRHLADALGVDWDELATSIHYDEEIRSTD